MKNRKLIAGLLAGLLAAGTTIALTSCGSEETTAEGYAKEIYLYNWSEYMTQEVLDGFEAEYGIRVVESTFESNDEMFAKLLAGNSGQYDIAVPSNFYIQAMLANDMLEELDFDAIPNMANIDEAYLNPSYDPENKYTIPYMGTIALWVGNTTKLNELGLTVNTYEDLQSDLLDGKVLMADDAQGNISVGLLACDLSPVSNSLDDIEAAKNYLISINDKVKAYSLPANVRDSMIKGEGLVAYMYSGNAMQAMQENSDLGIVMNQEQVSLSVDTMVILKGTKHKTEAELFLNYLLRPEVSAALLKEFPYVCFNEAAIPYLDEELASSPLVVVSDDMKSRIYMINDFNSDTITAEVNAMAEVKLTR